MIFPQEIEVSYEEFLKIDKNNNDNREGNRMKRLIVLMLLSVFVISGCSKGDGSEAKRDQEISKLKQENQELKQEINTLKGNKGEDSVGEVSDELGINEGIYSVKNGMTDETVEFLIKGYGYQDTRKDTFKDITTDGKFFILEVYVDNIGKQESRISQYCLIIDKQDREYECETIVDKNNEHAGRNLNPGFNATIYAIFEVPADFEADRYIYDFVSGHGKITKIDLDRLEEYKFDF